MEFSNGSARRDWFVVKSEQLVIYSFKAVQTGRELVEIFLATDERGLVRTERRQEGMYYRILRVIGKSSKLLESLTLFLLGAFFGYVSGENPGQNPEIAFRFLTGVFLLVSILLAGLIFQKFSFESKQNK